MEKRNNIGSVVQVIGPVVDIKFYNNYLPHLLSAIEIDNNGEMFIHGMHISPYEKGNIFNRDPLRPKKILLHKKEIMKLLGTVKQKGLTLIPLDMYLKGQRVKITIAVARGKKLYDKREDAAKRDAGRMIERTLKHRIL